MQRLRGILSVRDAIPCITNAMKTQIEDAAHEKFP
jgi:hypothetical protein